MAEWRWSVFEQYVALIDIIGIPKRSEASRRPPRQDGIVRDRARSGQVLMGIKTTLLLLREHIRPTLHFSVLSSQMAPYEPRHRSRHENPF
jgi:hypothetical protein